MSIHSWSSTASNNGTADPGINFAEGQLAATLNDSNRVVMKRIKDFKDDISAKTASTGSSNAYLLTTSDGFTAYSDGLMVGFTANFTNTAAATLSCNSIGAKSIYAAGSVLTGREIKAGGSYILSYDTALNSSAGGWHLLNPHGAKDKRINVLDYWLPSHSDHTTAIDAAFAASVLSLTADADRLATWAGEQRPVYFPPGNYTYSGSGVTISSSSSVLAFSDGPGAALIEITSDVYLITHSSTVISTLFSGFHIIGGRGAIAYTNSSTNVTGYHHVERCIFDGYTVCAVSNDATDHPYWHITGNYFHGADAGDTIGVALGGYLDSTRIRDNSFVQNKYHLKIGGYLSGTIDIHYNDFLMFNTGIRTADIWFVPSDVSGGVNSGSGTSIKHNKFGNENMGTSDTRILIAPEDAGSGSDRKTRFHDATWDSSGYYLTGLTIEDNRFSSVANCTAPVITSYILDVNNLEWRGNDHDGGSYTYLLQYMGTVTDDDAYVTRLNRFHIASPQDSVIPYSTGVVNYPSGLIDDPSGYFGTQEGVLLTGTQDDVGYAFLGGGGYSAITMAGSGASKATATDAFGSDGAELTFNGTTSTTYGYVTMVAPVAYRTTWLEFDVRAGATEALTTFSFDIFNTSSNRTALRRTNMPVSSAWRTVRIPFIMPDAASTSDWFLRVFPGDYSAGVKTKLRIARVAIYQARSYMQSGHIRTTGSGAWNAPHFIIGSYHLWIDSTGDLRIKSSAPSSDTDGTVVGAQS